MGSGENEIENLDVGKEWKMRLKGQVEKFGRAVRTSTPTILFAIPDEASADFEIEGMSLHQQVLFFFSLTEAPDNWAPKPFED